MTINSSAIAHDTYDVMGTTISEFYDKVDAAVLPSDVQPGRYVTNITPSYASQCPLSTGSFTTLDLGTVDPKVIMLDKSFIRMSISGHLTCNVALTPGTDPTINPLQYFLGWSRSIEALGRYQILHNGKTVIDQAYVGEESFIISNCIKNSVMKRRPGEYTTYDSAYNDTDYKCGVKLNITSSYNDGVKCTVPIGTKIPFEMKIKLHLDDIPFFKNWSILPGWYGNWQIRLWPDPKNLKMCQVNPTVCGCNADDAAYSHDFHQVGETFKCITGYDSSDWTASDATFTCTDYSLDICEYVSTSEVQYPSDYESNKNKYRQKPLNLPYQNFDLVRFNGRTGVAGGAASFVLTGMVKCAECLYLLPFTKDIQHTVCRNPQYQGFYLQIGQYGPYPNNPVDTVELVNGSLSDTYANFLNMTLDSLNLDNSPIMTANPDVLNSLHNDTKVHYLVNQAYTRAGSSGSYTYTIGNLTSEHSSVANNWCKSNFFIGIPFADDEQFQGGLTTNQNINIKMNYTDATYENDTELGPTAVFCCDYVLMISPNDAGMATISNVQDKLY